MTRQRIGRYLLHLALLILITAGVFSNTLDNDYHLDSIHRVKLNTEIEHFWPPWRFFTDIRTGSTVPQIAEYRPMMPLSHAINNELSRVAGISKLRGYHIGNIAIHTGSVMLVYFLSLLLLRRWGRTPADNQHADLGWSAFFAALIFAVHPISGSAVNYIAARDLLLMVFFFLASILVYIRMRVRGDNLAGWLLSLFLLCLAILSKQGAIVAFGLIFLFEWILEQTRLGDWRLWARSALFALPTAAYFLLRQLWILKQNPDDPLRTFNGLSYPLTMLDAHLFYYFRNFLWPFEMRALARIDMVDSLLSWRALAGLVFILASLFAAWWFRKRQPLISFSILAYWLLFALTSSIFPFRYVVTDYRQYLPLVFLSLGLTTWLYHCCRYKIASVLLSLMAIYFSLSAWQINRHWKTEQSFWAQSIKYGAAALAHNNYGLAIKPKDPELAAQHFAEALRQNPNHIYAGINLALIELGRGESRKGLARLERIVRLNPSWALAHYWYAKGLQQSGDQAAAVRELRQAADSDPRSLKYQYETAQALQLNGDYAASIPYLQRILKLNPDYQLSGFMLAFAYQKSGRRQQAIDRYRQFLTVRPEHMQSHFNLAYALMKSGRCQEAIEHFNKTLALKPDYREVNLYLAHCHETLGDAGQAKEE